MKTLRYFGVVLMTILLSLGFAACSSDDDDDNASGSTSIVGSWKQTSDGQLATVTFNANMTGVVTFVYYNDDGREIGSVTENFEYYYDAAKQFVKIYGDTELDGEWDVTITATMLILEDYVIQYRFTRV